MAATFVDPVTDGVAGGPDDGWHRATAGDGTGIAWRLDAPDTARHRGATPVVLCNGIACSTAYWTDLAALLADRRPVVQWDYRGHGRSDPPSDPSAVTVGDVLDDLDTVLDVTGVHRAVFVGHSFGVQVCLEVARRRPARVAAVVAIAGAAGTPLPAGAVRPRVGVLDLLERAHSRVPRRADEAWRAWWRSPWTHLLARAMGGTSVAAPRSVMSSYYEHVSTRDIGVLLAMLRAMQGHDASDVVGALTVPLLALAGDADRLTPLPVMAGLALAAPDGELAVCRGGAHTLPAEQPRWVLEQVTPLLDRVDGDAATAPAAAPVGA